MMGVHASFMLGFTHDVGMNNSSSVDCGSVPTRRRKGGGRVGYGELPATLRTMPILLIDNYDSFTYNIYHLIAEATGQAPVVVYNDTPLDEVRRHEFDSVVVSPGPGKPSVPEDFGISEKAIRDFGVPVLGVCLGHQGIGHFFGGRVVHAKEVMHGRISTVHLGDDALFDGMPASIDVVRYHSLVVEPELPASLKPIAWLADGTIMGLKHVRRPLYGVQFHPESILSQYGHELIANFHRLTRQYWESLSQHANKERS